MTAALAAHGAWGGPLDAFIDLGLPLLVVALLWALSARGRRKREEAARRQAAGDRDFYVSLGTQDLGTLVGMLEAREHRTADDERTLEGARAELARRGR